MGFISSFLILCNNHEGKNSFQIVLNFLIIMFYTGKLIGFTALDIHVVHKVHLCALICVIYLYRYFMRTVKIR